MNNFHGLMPEGYIRAEQAIRPNESDGRIINDLDELIKESSFDLEKYLEAARKRSEATH